MTDQEIRNKAAQLIEKMGITGEALEEYTKLDTFTQLQAIATFAHIGGDTNLRDVALKGMAQYA